MIRRIRSIGDRPSRKRERRSQVAVARASGSDARAGLTLIEVMLALAIMLLALVGIGRLVDMGTEHANDARLTARGNRLAEAKMAEVEAGAVSLLSTSSGDFAEEPGWSWTVNPEPQGPPNLYRVTVTVSRDNRGRQFTTTLSQMVVDPEARGSAAQAEKPADSGSSDPAAGGTMP